MKTQILKFLLVSVLTLASTRPANAKIALNEVEPKVFASSEKLDLYSTPFYFIPKRDNTRLERVLNHAENKSRYLPNDPVFNSTPRTGVDIGDNYEYIISVSDSNNPFLTASGGNLPAWLTLSTKINAQVSTFAGSTNFARIDGDLNTAEFQFPWDIETDANGNIYVADDNSIRKIDANGNVSTITSDTSQGPFLDLAIAANGDIYASTGGSSNIHKILKVTQAGVITVFAGGASTGFQDGNGTNALFDNPGAIEIDSDGNIYVVDGLNFAIRKITPSGDVTTLAGNGSRGDVFGVGQNAQFGSLNDIALDTQNNIYVVDGGNHKIKKISPIGEVSLLAGSGVGINQNGIANTASFASPNGISFDGANYFYVTTFTHKVTRVSLSGDVVIVAGGNSSGLQNGDQDQALFNRPQKLKAISQSELLIPEVNNGQIRKLEIQGTEQSLTGSSVGQLGSHNVSLFIEGSNGSTVNQDFVITVGAAIPPVFTSSNAVDFDENKTGVAYTAIATDNSIITYSLGSTKDESLFTVNGSTGEIAFVTPPDFESPIDGDTNNKYELDVIATDAKNDVTTQAVTINVTNVSDNDPVISSTPTTTINEGLDYSYSLLASDADNDDLTFTAPTLPAWLTFSTKIASTTTTFAGSTQGSADGTLATAQFSSPFSILQDGNQNYFVSDAVSIRKFDPNGNVTTITNDNSQGLFLGLTMDSNGDLFATTGNAEDGRISGVLKITQAGVVSVFAGSTTEGLQDGNGTVAQFKSPVGITTDINDNLYVADAQNHIIRKITPAGEVTTFVGNGDSGDVNATGSAARLNNPYGIIRDGQGGFFITDAGNAKVKRITAAGEVSTIAGNGTSALQDGDITTGSFLAPIGLTFDGADKLFVTDGNTIRQTNLSGDIATVSGNADDGTINGNQDEARFTSPAFPQLISATGILIPDAGSGLIRKVEVTGNINILEGSTTGQVGQHNVSLLVDDGNGGTDTQDFTITVVDVTPPAFTSGTVIGFAENSTADVYTAAATDASSFTFSLSNSKDEALFNIDASTGVLTFISSPDFEAPADSNTDNSYEVDIIATDALNNAATLLLTVNVTNVSDNDPVISSTPSTTINEGLDYSYSLLASDADNDDLTFTAPTLPAWLTLSTKIASTTTTFAGSTQGSADGTLATAQFSSPFSIIQDGNQNYYVADEGSIRKIDSNGNVTTLTNDFSKGGFLGLAIDSNGDLFATTASGNGGSNAGILKITQAGVVSIFAGSNTKGLQDGNGAAAQFEFPLGITIDSNDNLYVADAQNHVIRKITPAGEVTTFVGNGESGDVNATGSAARLNNPGGIIQDGQGGFFITDGGNAKVKRISAAGEVSTIAGNGTSALQDGDITTGSFIAPIGLTFDGADKLFVTDGNTIRQVGLTGDIATVSGNADDGTDNGNQDEARFTGPAFLHLISPTELLIPEFGSVSIRKVEVTGNINVLEGSTTGQVGQHNVSLLVDDGNGGTDTQDFTITVVDVTPPVFTSGTVIGFAENSTANVYTAAATDASSFTFSLGNLKDEALFNIDASTGVLTFISSPDFEAPADANTDNSYEIDIIATDAVNNASTLTITITVSNINDNDPVISSTPITTVNEDENYSYTIATSDPDVGDIVNVTGTVLPSWLSINNSQDGLVTTFAGNGTSANTDGTGTVAEFEFPLDVAVDNSDNLYVADFTAIRKITPAGVVSTLYSSTNGQGFSSLVVNANGTVFVAEGGEGAIRIVQVSPAGVRTEFVGGSGPNDFGDSEGTGTAARFLGISGMAFDIAGDLFVTDAGNNKIRKITPAGVVTTFAGSGNSGDTDGTGTAASFDFPQGLTIDGTGNLYIADGGNNKIRKITSAGVVTTLAGSGSSGAEDGTGMAASFNSPHGLAIDASGNIIVADRGNDNIRRVSTIGVVTTLAGSGNGAFADGTGTAAEFDSPYGVTVDSNGNVFVADGSNLRIRKIVIPEAAFRLTGDPAGQVGVHNVTLTADDGNGRTVIQDFTITVLDVTPPVFTSSTSVDFLENATTTVYTAVATDNAAVTYSLSNTKDEALFNINASTGVLTFISSPDFEVPTDANTDNVYEVDIIATDALNNAATLSLDVRVKNIGENDPFFNSTLITTVNEEENYQYVLEVGDLDKNNLTVSGSTLPSWLTLNLNSGGSVSTFAGSIIPGLADGLKFNAKFDRPSGAAIDKDGNIYVSERDNHVVRKILPDGTVSTFAGSGAQGNSDGQGANASFNEPIGIDIDADGNLYVADAGNNLIRKISQGGTVSTFAGSGAQGNANGVGTAATFWTPLGLVVDPSGDIYVTDANNHLIRKITPNGTVTTFAGSALGTSDGNGTAALFSSPWGIDIDEAGNLYVADVGSSNIRKITASGTVTTIAGSGSTGFVNGNGTNASFNEPQDIAVSGRGIVYIADSGNGVIRQIDTNGEVSTFAGSSTRGFADGLGTDATFQIPAGIDIDVLGNIYVADAGNHLIRKISGPQYELSGSPIGQVGTHDVVLEVNDGTGRTAQQSFTITVTPAPDPVMTSVYKSAENKITLGFDKVVTTTGTNPEDFTVTDCRGNTFTVIALTDEQLSDELLELTVPTLSSAFGDITVRFANNNDQVRSTFDKKLQTDQVGIFFNTGAYEIQNAIWEGIDESYELPEGQAPFGFTFSNDGLKMFSIDRPKGKVFEFLLSQPFDASTAVYAGDNESLDITAQDDLATTLRFNNDGTRMYFNGNRSRAFYTYILSIPFDVSTATYLGDSERFFPRDANAAARFEFNNNGSKLFVLSIFTAQILQYSLSTPYDLTTAVFDGQNEAFSTEQTTPQDGFAFDPSGLKMFIMDGTSSSQMRIKTFSLDNPFDISTAVNAGVSFELDIFDQFRGAEDLAFSPDGSKVFFLHFADPARSSATQISEWSLIDKTAPVIVDGAKDSNTQITLTFDDQVYSNNGNPADFSVVDAAGTSFSVTAQSDDVINDNNIVLTTADLSTAVGALTVTYTNNNAEIGNLNCVNLENDQVEINIAPRVVSITRKDANPLQGSVGRFDVVFTEAVTGVDATDFNLAITGGVTANIGTVESTDNINYVVTITDVVGAGTVGLNLEDDDSILDSGQLALVGEDAPDGGFTGEIYDTNSIPTDISITSNSLDENNALSATIGSLSTVDADTNDSHTYQLVNGTGSDDNTSFLIDGNELKSNSISFDFETKASYNIRLETDDGRGGTFQKAFTISINDVNEIPISLDLSNQSIPESDETQLVGLLTSLDQDNGDSFTFELVNGAGDDDNTAFIISDVNLNTAGAINFEDGATRSIRVRVTDSGGLSIEEVFVINITDVEIEPLREFDTNAPGAAVHNVFSPNGDGVNETWVIRDLEDNPINEVKIFAQGGKLIYSKVNYQNDWDATFKGEPIPDGTYYYEINIYDGQRIIKGFLTIIRNK